MLRFTRCTTSQSGPRSPWRPTAVGLAIGAAVLASPAAAAPVFTTVAPLPSNGHLSARGDVVVMTQTAGTQTTLLAGRGGAVPTPIVGTGPLPTWARPHVGTNRSGHVVAVYPRCSGPLVATCDLYVYDFATLKETALAGVSRPNAGEVEGDMDRGAMAFSRWRLKAEPTGSGDEATTLLYKPASGAARVVSKTKGGQQLALRGQQIGQIRDINPSAASCGTPSVELLSTSGSRRLIRQSHCGEEGNHPTGLDFVGSRLHWMFVRIVSGSFARYDVKSNTLQTDPFKNVVGVSQYAPLTSTTGLTIRETSTGFPGSPRTWELDNVTGLSYPDTIKPR